MGAPRMCDRQDVDCLVTSTAYDVVRSVNTERRSEGKAPVAGMALVELYQRASAFARILAGQGRLQATTSRHNASTVVAAAIGLQDFHFMPVASATPSRVVPRDVAGENRYDRRKPAPHDPLIGHSFVHQRWWRHYIDGPDACTQSSGTVVVDTKGQCASGEVAYVPDSFSDTSLVRGASYACIARTDVMSPYERLGRSCAAYP